MSLDFMGLDYVYIIYAFFLKFNLFLINMYVSFLNEHEIKIFMRFLCTIRDGLSILQIKKSDG